MEIVDLVYLRLLQEFNGVSYGNRQLTVDYIYNHRSVDVAVGDWILLYASKEEANWLGIGAQNILKTVTVVVDVRTNNKEAYGKIKQKIQQNFTQQIFYRFVEGTATDITVNVVSSSTIGTYLDKVTVNDSSPYSVNEYVQYGDEKGWIVWINGNDLYVFKRKGVYFSFRPKSIVDLSDKMKLLYRFTLEIEGYAIQ